MMKLINLRRRLFPCAAQLMIIMIVGQDVPMYKDDPVARGDGGRKTTRDYHDHLRTGRSKTSHVFLWSYAPGAEVLLR
jgi:hypothetical protein